MFMTGFRSSAMMHAGWEGGEVLGADGELLMNLDLIESLTWRETEILRLLDARLSNVEIAEVLDVSTGAVKRHADIIYRKLVVGRRDAIAPEDGSLS